MASPGMVRCHNVHHQMISVSCFCTPMHNSIQPVAPVSQRRPQGPSRRAISDRKKTPDVRETPLIGLKMPSHSP